MIFGVIFALHVIARVVVGQSDQHNQCTRERWGSCTAATDDCFSEGDHCGFHCGSGQQAMSSLFTHLMSFHLHIYGFSIIKHSDSLQAVTLGAVCLLFVGFSAAQFRPSPQFRRPQQQQFRPQQQVPVKIMIMIITRIMIIMTMISFAGDQLPP